MESAACQPDMLGFDTLVDVEFKQSPGAYDPAVCVTQDTSWVVCGIDSYVNCEGCYTGEDGVTPPPDNDDDKNDEEWSESDVDPDEPQMFYTWLRLFYEDANEQFHDELFDLWEDGCTIHKPSMVKNSRTSYDMYFVSTKNMLNVGGCGSSTLLFALQGHAAIGSYKIARGYNENTCVMNGKTVCEEQVERVNRGLTVNESSLCKACFNSSYSIMSTITVGLIAIVGVFAVVM